MSALSTREALADALGAMPEAYNVTDHTDEQTTMIAAPVEVVADALIASGAVVDAATLADDEALIYDELLPWCRSQEVERGAEIGSGVRHTLRALAAALAERGA